MSKKKRRKVKPAEYAARLARGGSATLDVLTDYEEHVRADPQRWAEPFGATEEQMLAGIALLRSMVMRETLNSALVAAEV